MNILKELMKKASKKATVKSLLGEETFCFLWNAPARNEDIESFECRNKCNLPDEYKDFLLTSNFIVGFK